MITITGNEYGQRTGGRGRWEQEASSVRLLAAELGVTVCDEEMIYYDISDLILYRAHLRRRLTQPSRARFTLPFRHMSGEQDGRDAERPAATL